MQPIARVSLDRQDLPILFLAWLLPATFLLLAPTHQIWPGAWFSSDSSVGTTISWTNQVWSLALLLTFIAAAACCALQLIGKRGMLIALSFCSVSVVVLAPFVPDRSGVDAFQLVLLMGLMAFSVYGRQMAKLGIGAGLCASALLVAAPQTAPFAVIAAIWFAGDWAVNRGEHGGLVTQKTLCFGYSIASGTFVLGVSYQPDWAVASLSCGPGSPAYLAPAIVAGLGLAHLAKTATEFSSLRKRLGCIGFVALLALTGSLAINPDCLLTATHQQGSFLLETFSLFSVLSRDPHSAYILLATPAIGVGAASIAILREGGRSAWALMLGSLIAAIVVLIIDVRWAIYANGLAVIPCAYLVILVGEFTRRSRPTPFAAVAFLVVWLSGMNITHNLVAKYVLPGSSAALTHSTLSGSSIRS